MFLQGGILGKIVLDFSLKCVIFFWICVVVNAFSCSHYVNDNIVEELEEEILQNELGTDAELSPFTPEYGRNAIPFF